MRQTRWLSLPVLLVLLACGEEMEPDEPLAVVFTAEYLDVHGSLTIEVEGFNPVELEDAEQFSCDRPALTVEKAEEQRILEIYARGSKFLSWKKRVLLTRERDCVVVDIGPADLYSGLLYAVRSGPPECFPIDFYVAYTQGGEREHIGTLTQPWTPIMEELPTVGNRTRMQMEAAREGKTVLFGGDPPDDEWIVYYFFEEGPCFEQSYPTVTLEPWEYVQDENEWRGRREPPALN